MRFFLPGVFYTAHFPGVFYTGHGLPGATEDLTSRHLAGYWLFVKPLKPFLFSYILVVSCLAYIFIGLHMCPS